MTVTIIIRKGETGETGANTFDVLVKGLTNNLKADSSNALIVGRFYFFTSSPPILIRNSDPDEEMMTYIKWGYQHLINIQAIFKSLDVEEMLIVVKDEEEDEDE